MKGGSKAVAENIREKYQNDHLSKFERMKQEAEQRKEFQNNLVSEQNAEKRRQLEKKQQLREQQLKDQEAKAKTRG